MRPALIGLAAVLALVLALQWATWRPDAGVPEQATGAAPDGAHETTAAIDALAPAPPIADYASVRERPLFLPGRRPLEAQEAEPEPVPPPAPPTSMDTADLTAVLLTPTASVAWVRIAQAREAVRLHPGEELEGWVLSQIAPDRVTFVHGEHAHEIMLRDYANAPPAITPTPFLRNRRAPPQDDAPPGRAPVQRMDDAAEQARREQAALRHKQRAEAMRRYSAGGQAQ
ncbi:hypothetical protein F2Q65_01860 [Thiohalocapsa marina]|uniref:Type II secretion system protein GspC N-terminal domain-containing protein n=1 Tax=Thiohalocapsa marina TaxID=424902 RepID=A0A5M8FU14_9GAMM|nr:hypothetical protein [Thiohalocapsa marina]KAA6187297.1 hypothetical protein F2Q65_01860 [Thiohalocapsa marina]